MPATVYLYSNTDYTKRLGQTSRAFDCVITKELMREHTLKFNIANSNPFFKLLLPVRTSSAFECDGQLFDVTSIDTESGESNTTQIAAEHVSYRLSDYMIPDNYSFVGTLPQIVADILDQGININDEKASAVFSVGDCYNGLGNVTYALIGQENITVRAALLGLTYLGIEVDFDNFKINCPLRIGSDNGSIFDFNTNLKRFRRYWDRDNDCTYEVDVADRGDIRLGDDITVRDDFIGDETKKRIITYSKCIDDPTRNAVTLGVFVLDTAAASIETGLAIDALNSKADSLSDSVGSSVQQGKKYNNVAITHELGFVSSRADNKVRIIANGTDCFAVQKNINGVWVTVTQADELGIASAILTDLAARNEFYATVGLNEFNNPGFFLYQNSASGWIRFLDIWRSVGGNSMIESQSGDLLLVAPYGSKPKLIVRDAKDNTIPYGADGYINLGNIRLTMSTGLLEKIEGVNAFGTVNLGNISIEVGNGNITSISGGSNFSGAVNLGNLSIKVGNGNITSISDGSNFSGTITLANKIALKFKNGVLTEATEQ